MVWASHGEEPLVSRADQHSVGGLSLNLTQARRFQWDPTILDVLHCCGTKGRGIFNFCGLTRPMGKGIIRLVSNGDSIAPVEVMVMMTAVMTAKTKIAESMGLTEDQLFQQALVSFLHEKKREVLQHRLDILVRYGADSLADLESKIAQGIVAEHPAWEELIVAENLTVRLEELDAYLDDLQGAEDDRSQ